MILESVDKYLGCLKEEESSAQDIILKRRCTSNGSREFEGNDKGI
jgi:hypothetical protein